MCSMGLFLLGCSSSCSVLLLYTAWSTTGGLCFILIEASWNYHLCVESTASGGFKLLVQSSLAGCISCVSGKSNVDGFGLASWFYLVAAFVELVVLLHLAGVARCTAILVC